MKANYEKWLWIELIGFDNQEKHLGVNNFLDRVGFIPDGLSLLLYNPDFIHSHRGLRENSLLDATFCSYGARSCNEERKRQEWTKFQLQYLVSELQKHGIAVYFSVFDQIISHDGRERLNIPQRPEWLEAHHELLYVTGKAENISYLCPLKRLEDGTYYEDFFVRQLRAVLEDYGFDGFHGADGYAHPRIPVYNGDFSDDMIEQFTESTSIVVPAGKTPEKADWILKCAGWQWRDFHARRQQRFWEKTVTMLRSINRKLIFNTAWTRDPFEAKYRYGVDYRLLADIGVHEFIVEAPAAVVELEGWNKTPYSTLDKYMSMIMRIKAYVPDCKLILLNCIKDGMEQYNVLRHAPAMLESEIFSMANVFSTVSDGKTEKCLSGVMACLADGITSAEWEMIKKNWDNGLTPNEEVPVGATVVWSVEAFAREYENYVSSSTLCNSYQMHYRLLGNGAPLCNICDIGLLDSMRGCLAVIHPIFFTADELQALLNYRHGPVIFAGMEIDNVFRCTVYNDGKMIFQESFALNASNELKPDSWLNELPAAEPFGKVFKQIAQIISRYSYTMKLSSGRSSVKGWKIQTGEFTERLLIRNDNPYYASAEIDTQTDIKTTGVCT